MLSLKSVLVAEMAAAGLALGALFAVPASALPGDDSNCPEGAQKTCTQTPPEHCPAGTSPALVQPAAGGGVTCNLDSLIRARAKADVLTHDELLKLCADVQVRGLANVRVAVGHPVEVITLDGRTCAPKRTGFKDCWTAGQAGYHDVPRSDPRYDPRLDGDHDGIACETLPAVEPPAPNPVPAPLPPAPAPQTVTSNLPVTH